MKKFVATLIIASFAVGAASANRMPGRKEERISPDTVKAVQAGDAAMQAGDFATAISEYTKAIQSKELKGDNLGAILLNRGIAYVSVKQCPEASADFTGAIEASSAPHPSAYAGRGQCHMEAGQTAEGIADMKQAIALAPTEATYVGALCTSAFNAKIFVEAGPACEAYSVFVPTDAQIVEASAVAYQNAGNKAKALEMWNRLLALDPNSAVAKQGVQQNS